MIEYTYDLKTTPLRWSGFNNIFYAKVLGLMFEVFKEKNGSFTIRLHSMHAEEPTTKDGFATLEDAMQHAEKVMLLKEIKKAVFPPPLPPLSVIEEIVLWTKKWQPNPCERNISTQIGCHLEEVCEMLIELGVRGEVVEALQSQSEMFKHHQTDLNTTELTAIEHTALLDALCDQIVTATALGTMLGYDMEGALQEVNRSNWSKFQDSKPLFDHNGKLKKGNQYQPPELRPFIWLDTDETQ